MGLYLGLMSGTSMDAIDAALVDFGETSFRLVACSATPFSHDLKRRVAALIEFPQTISLDELGQVDVLLGQAFADASLALMRAAGVGADAIDAIGSHGQTVRHRPDLPAPFTTQIGDPNTLAESTGITVVADFRRRDIAAGGQGAPLLPVFHDQVFRCENEDRAILNLGGIANMTILRHGGVVSGFDTGPGNRLLDAWIAEHQGRDFDENGDWGSGGVCDATLLGLLLDEPYFRLSPPKSTGRELFNLGWLHNKLGGTDRAPQDVQATLLQFTAASVAAAVKRHAAGSALYVCGGGAHNQRLMSAIAERVAPHPVASTVALGLDPDYVEAIAFAWFARRTMAGLTSSAGSVTGARGARILGGVYRHA